MLLEDVIKTWPPVDPRTRPGQLEAPHPLPCPWNVHSDCLPYSQKLFQGYRLKTEMWFWGYLDWICDWPQQMSAEIYLSCGSLRQVLEVPLSIKPVTYQKKKKKRLNGLCHINCVRCRVINGWNGGIKFVIIHCEAPFILSWLVNRQSWAEKHKQWG